MTPSLRSVLMAKTLLFNYGRGDRTPNEIFFKLCTLTKTEPKLNYPPNFKSLWPIQFSFFSKQPSRIYKQFEGIDLTLYWGWEQTAFLGLGTTEKLAWLYNCTNAKTLLFSNTQEELVEIDFVLRNWKRAEYDIYLGRKEHELIFRGTQELSRGQIRGFDGTIFSQPHH